MFKNLFFLVISIFMLIGCGGGGSSDNDSNNTTVNNTINTGVFIDSAVEGLIFSTSSGIKGITNSAGEYQFRDGDTVEFFVGNLSIGSMKANELLSVFNTMYPSQVAMLLQSLDADGNPNNGITINTNTQELFKNTDLIISEVSSEDESFKTKFKKITGNDFVVTEFDSLSHAKSSLGLEMLKNRPFYDYYIGNIDVYSNSTQFNGVELAKSSSKRMALYYFNYAVLPFLEAESIQYKYDIDSSINRNEVSRKNLKVASELLSLATTVTMFGKSNSELLGTSVGVIFDEAFSLAQEPFKDGNNWIDFIGYTAIEELKLINSCSSALIKGAKNGKITQIDMLENASNCTTALTSSALGSINNLIASGQLYSASHKLNDNSIVQEYLSDYFNFAGDYEKINGKYGLTSRNSVEDVLVEIVAHNPTLSFGSKTATELRYIIQSYQSRVFIARDKLLKELNLNANMSTEENTNLDVTILDGVSKLVANGNGATLSTSYKIKNNSLFQIENSSIVLSIIPKGEDEIVLSTQNDYAFPKVNTENFEVDLAIDSTIYNKIIANPYVLKLSVTYDGKTTTDSKILEASTQNELYELIKNNTPPIIKINAPLNVYANTITQLSAFESYSVIEDDTLSYQWEFLSTDKVSDLLLEAPTSARITFVSPVIPAGKSNLELIFKLTVISKISGLSSSKEIIVNLKPLINPLPIENNKPTTTGQSISLNQDTTKAITLSANDVDKDDILRYDIVDNTKNGTLSGIAPNLTYTPESEYSGEDSFTFKVNDGKIDSDSSKVSITVNKVINKQITFMSQSIPSDGSVVLRGSSFVKSWTFKNSGNIDLSNLKVQTVNAPSGLIATINQNVSNTLKQNATTTYALNISVPSNLQEGTYEVKYKLTDSNVDLKYPNGNITYFTYKFVVSKPNDFKAYAYLSSSTYSTDENALLSVVVNDGNKPYQISINWGDGTSLTTAQITNVSEVKNFTHKYLSEGNYVVTTNITDSMGKTAQVKNSVTIKNSVDSTTKWSVSGADLITNTNQENLNVQITDASTHSVYTTSWMPQSTSDDYWITYKLPIPKDLIKMTNKLRVSFVGKAGELEDYDRAITLALSDGKNYSYNFMTNINNGSGFIRIKDYQGSDTKQLVSSLTDSSVLVRQNDRAYAIENNYLGTSSNSTLSAYKFENSSYSSLSSTSKSITASNSLKELQINLKGNGTITLLKLEYDKNGDKNYSSDETIILNTDSMIVDWSSFIDENNEEAEQISYVIDDGISDTKVIFKAEDNIANITVPSDAWIRIVPKSYTDADNYSMAIRCKIQSDGRFENNCFIYSEQRADFDRVLADENETYQIVVFKNHVNVDDKHWEANEDLYKYVGDSEANWSDIVVLKENYQNNSQPNETITHGVFTYGTVTSPYTGRVWLDRNIGASRVCQSFDDISCYGDYFQWGRGIDGHEKIDSQTTSIQSSSVSEVGHGDFITTSDTYDYDWINQIDSDGSLRAEQWSKTDGSSICPIGFRVPTIVELEAETLDSGINNIQKGYNSFLKLPISFIREYAVGHIYTDIQGHLWSTSKSATRPYYLALYENSGNSTLSNFAYAMSVRCIQDTTLNTKINSGISNSIIQYLDEEKNNLSIPSNSWLRITPLDYQIEGKYWGLNCKVDINGSFGDDCYSHDLSEEEILKAVTENNSFQLILYEDNNGDKHYSSDNESLSFYSNYQKVNSFSNENIIFVKDRDNNHL